jgi:hypothetical protein
VEILLHQSVALQVYDPRICSPGISGQAHLGIVVVRFGNATIRTLDDKEACLLAVLHFWNDKVLYDEREL